MLYTMCNCDIRINHFLKAGKITSHLVLVFLLTFNVQFLAGYNINCTNIQSFPAHKMTRCAETLLATLTYSAQTINGKDSPHIEASD